MPRTLFWRTFLLIAALLVLSMLAWFQIFRWQEREPRAVQLADMVASIVNLTRAALVNAQPERRRELLAELSEREGIRVYLAEPDDRVVVPPDAPVFRRLQELLTEALGSETRLAVERDGLPGFWVSFRIGDDDYWVMLPRERVERRRALKWLGWGAAALAFALLGAGLVVSRVVEPLRALARAAAEIGRGRHPPAIAERGPQEVRTLARAFNEMSRDLARLDDDRALMLAGVSHDLRTPLARLRLGVEMSGGDPQLKSGMAADIEDVDRIIGQFLELARIDRGGAAALEPTDLGALVADVAAHSRETGPALDTEIGSPLPTVRARPVQMRRVIANLVDNAFRHGGGEVRLVARRDDRAVVLEVMDRGPGVPPGETERLKQPFTRLENARSDGGGAGLGLAIVDRIVRGHEGRFDLLPRPGGGLVARVTLPVAAA
jgi:two-component system osmolarity sensor histidine kinase EnvZ